MMRGRRFLSPSAAMLVAALAFATAPPAGAYGAGVGVTLEAPHTYSANVSFTVRGWVQAFASVPLVLEEAVGLADQRVEVLADGVVAAEATSGRDGSWSASLSFGPRPPTTRTLRAVIFRGTPAERSSAPATISIDRFVIELEAEPGSMSLPSGATASVRAFATFDDGRRQDVTEDAAWTTSDASVATVSNMPGSRGRVTAMAPGSATVTAAYGGLDATAAVVVSH